MELRDKDGLTEAEFLANYREKDYPKPSLTADLIVFRKDFAGVKLLLIQRSGHPYLGCWALPGGFVNKGESAEQAAERELKEETGLEGIAISQLGLYSAPRRDPRGWVVSQAFVATAKGFLRTRAGDDAGKAGWFSVNSEGIRRVSLTLTRGDTLLEIEAERVRDPVLSTDKAEIISSSGLAFDHAQMITDAWMRLGW